VDEFVLRIHPTAVKALSLCVSSGFSVSADADLSLGVWDCVSRVNYGVIPDRARPAQPGLLWRPDTLLSDDQRWLVSMKLAGMIRTEIRAYDLRGQ